MRVLDEINVYRVERETTLQWYMKRSVLLYLSELQLLYTNFLLKFESFELDKLFISGSHGRSTAGIRSEPELGCGQRDRDSARRYTVAAVLPPPSILIQAVYYI